MIEHIVIWTNSCFHSLKPGNNIINNDSYNDNNNNNTYIIIIQKRKLNDFIIKISIFLSRYLSG